MLISDTHKKRYVDYYAGREVKSKPHKWQEDVEAVALAMRAETVLDYGCGVTRALSKHSKLAVVDYDPVLPGFDNVSALQPVDLVVCNHVLEHVELECLDDILFHIESLSKKGAYIAVSCELSTKKLPDGTEWHLIVKEPEWWRRGFSRVFPGYVEIGEPDKKTDITILWARPGA